MRAVLNTGRCTIALLNLPCASRPAQPAPGKNRRNRHNTRPSEQRTSNVIQGLEKAVRIRDVCGAVRRMFPRRIAPAKQVLFYCCLGLASRISHLWVVSYPAQSIDMVAAASPFSPLTKTTTTTGLHSMKISDRKKRPPHGAREAPQTNLTSIYIWMTFCTALGARQPQTHPHLFDNLRHLRCWTAHENHLHLPRSRPPPHEPGIRPRLAFSSPCVLP
jgi:hypothetical protein